MPRRVVLVGKVPAEPSPPLSKNKAGEVAGGGVISNLFLCFSSVGVRRAEWGAELLPPTCSRKQVCVHLPLLPSLVPMESSGKVNIHTHPALTIYRAGKFLPKIED